MKHLLEVCDDEKELYRALKFFYKRDCSKFNDKKKRERQKLERLQIKQEKYGINNEKTGGEWQQGVWNSDGTELVYGLWHNSIVSRITAQAVRDYRQLHLLRHSAMFGQKLIIDLDYDKYMKMYECRLLAGQIGILYYENRLNRDYPEELPFDVHFTNCANGQSTMESLKKHIKQIDKLSPYFHQQSYTKLPSLFPKNKLVYLSPHASKPLPSYSHDDIYILGGYNDKSSGFKVSHVKAQSEGIRCYRLPLDENVLWKQGNKNLCLNQVAQILHSVKVTNDWRLAIQQFAPQRKIKSHEEIELEDEIRIRRVAQRMKNIQKSYDSSSFT